ncbi:MAG: hypothetical protein QOF57_1923 [Frankiaceae bacterium]|nr:hypothetical protein [Frankiaceae bacterium]
MIDHVSFEVSDLARSAAFYDAMFFALGVRRIAETETAIAYGVTGKTFWIKVVPGLSAPGSGHVAFAARGKAAVEAAHEAALAAGGADAGAPGPRPEHGRMYYAGYLRDPDGFRVELVSGSS